MKTTLAAKGVLALVCASACVGSPKDKSRERVASVLKESLGEAADPQVAFERDSTHLLVELATVAFPTMPESTLTDQARQTARFAIRHYEKASQLDSITVLYREAIRPGAWWIRHERTFSIEQLRSGR